VSTVPGGATRRVAVAVAVAVTVLLGWPVRPAWSASPPGSPSDPVPAPPPGQATPDGGVTTTPDPGGTSVPGSATSGGGSAGDGSSGLPLDPVSGLGDVTRGLFGGVASDAGNAVLDAVTTWVERGTASVLGSVIDALDQHTEPDLQARWLRAHYLDMVGIAALFALPLLLATAVTAIARQDAGPLLRAVAVHLPIAAIGTGAAMEVVRLALAGTDVLCQDVSRRTGHDTGVALARLRSLLDHGLPGAGGFAVVLVCVLVCLAAFVLTLELVVRTAAVYVAVLFLPLALAGWVWPATARWTRRLVETLAVLILSKFVVVAVVSLADAAVAGGLGGDGLSGLLSGAALLMLAAAAPFALLRLVPVVEAGMVGHLEGMARRPLPIGPGPSRDVVSRLLAGGMGPPGPDPGVGGGSPRPLPDSALERGIAADGTQDALGAPRPGDPTDAARATGPATTPSSAGEVASGSGVVSGSEVVSGSGIASERGVASGSGAASGAGGAAALPAAGVVAGSVAAEAARRRAEGAIEAADSAGGGD